MSSSETSTFGCLTIIVIAVFIFGAEYYLKSLTGFYATIGVLAYLGIILLFAWVYDKSGSGDISVLFVLGAAAIPVLMAILLGLIGFLIYFTYPLCFFTLAAAAAWYFTWKAAGHSFSDPPGKNETSNPDLQTKLLDAAAKVFGSVAIGCGLVTLALLILNALSLTPADEWIRSTEEYLIFLRLWVNDIVSLNLLRVTGLKHYFAGYYFLGKLASFILLVSFMLLITFYLPKFPLVSGFFWLKGKISPAVIILNVITSFTFFTNLPLDAAAYEAHQKRVENYRASLREEWEKTAEYLAARDLKESLSNLDAPSKEQYRAEYQRYFQNHNRKDPSGQFGDLLIKAQAIKVYGRDNDQPRYKPPPGGADNGQPRYKSAGGPDYGTGGTSSGTADEPQKFEEEIIVESVPETLSELSRQEELIGKQKERVSHVSAGETEMDVALEKTFTQVILAGAVPEEFHEITKAFVKKLVVVLCETVYDKIVEVFQRKRARNVEEREAVYSEDIAGFNNKTKDFLAFSAQEVKEKNALEKAALEKAALEKVGRQSPAGRETAAANDSVPALGDDLATEQPDENDPQEKLITEKIRSWVKKNFPKKTLIELVMLEFILTNNRDFRTKIQNGSKITSADATLALKQYKLRRIDRYSLPGNFSSPYTPGKPFRFDKPFDPLYPNRTPGFGTRPFEPYKPGFEPYRPPFEPYRPPYRPPVRVFIP